MLKILNLFVLTITSFISQSFAMEGDNNLNPNKKNISYMERLDKLRHKREKSFHDHTKSVVDQYNIYEKYSKKIGSLLSLNGSYYDKHFKGCKLRKATNHETQYVLFLIAQTTDYFRGMPNAISNLYSLSEERIKNDKTYAKQMAFITASHTARFAIINRYPSPINYTENFRKNDLISFDDWFEQQREKKDVEPEFKEHIKSIITDINTLEDQNILVKLIDKELEQKDWNNLIDQLGLVMDIIAPEIDLADIIDLLAIDNHKGWDIHRLSGQYAVLGKGSEYKQYINQFIKDVIKNDYQRSKEYITSITYSGSLFDNFYGYFLGGISIEESKKLLNNNLIALKYGVCFSVKNENDVRKEFKFSFCLTKKLNSNINKKLLTEISADTFMLLDQHNLKVKRLQSVMEDGYNAMYLHQSAVLGSKTAIHMLDYGLREEGKEQDSCLYYKIAANRGDTPSQFVHGLNLHLENCYDEAEIYYKMVINQGNFEPHHNYLELLAKRDLVNKTKKYLEKCIEKNIYTPESIAHYAEILYFQDKDYIEARKFFKKAADHENTCFASAYKYSLMAKEGQGGSKDIDEFEKYCKLSTRGNYLPAINEMIRYCVQQNRLF